MSKKAYKTIGGIIRKHRCDLGLTQMELAERLGYDSPQFVSLLERGYSKVPHETIGQLLVLLDLPEKQITKLLLAHYTESLKSEFQLGKSQIQQRKNVHCKSG